MKKILQTLFEYKTLDQEEARQVLLNISRGQFNESEITAFITVFMMRSISLDELKGFREALLELCVPLDLPADKIMDIVGTGGDGKNTFNISTLACFIVAGCGQQVVKHGNYGASTISGASNLMEELGYKFRNDSSRLSSELEKAGVCFLHAPLFHPALKTVAPIRKNLGIRSFFNMLGPLVNPANPNYHIIGVYNLEMARLYNYLLQQTTKNFTIIHGLDGYDEISLTGDTRLIDRQGERTVSAIEIGKKLVSPQDIYGGNSTKEAAKIFMNILSGKGSWSQNAVVLANAAIALNSTGNYNTYQDAYFAAVESLESGRAKNTLQNLLEINA